MRPLQIAFPVWVAHDPGDTISPFEYSRRLVETAATPPAQKCLVEVRGSSAPQARFPSVRSEEKRIISIFQGFLEMFSSA